VPERSRLDQLVDIGVAEAEIATGRAPEVVVSEFGRIAIGQAKPNGSRPPRWAPWEDEFVQAKLGLLSLEAIGRRLGRSANAVKIRQVREGWRAPSRREGWLTGHRAAKLLRVDVHAIMRLCQGGVLPHRRTPNVRSDYFIRRQDLYSWALNPMNWLYFRPERVLDPRLRRMLELRRQRWGDEWWTTGQAATYHGVESGDVERLILRGEIHAVRWGNWRLLRSEAMKAGLWFVKGKGTGSDLDWSEEGDAFLVRSRAAGDEYVIIAHKMGRQDIPAAVRSLGYRMKRLRESGQLEWLISKYDLPVQYDRDAISLSLTKDD